MIWPEYLRRVEALKQEEEQLESEYKRKKAGLVQRRLQLLANKPDETKN